MTTATLNLQSIEPALKESNIEFAGLFGSYAKKSATKKSDVDILIKSKKTLSLLELIGLEMKLSRILRKKVDLVTERSIEPILKKEILNNLVKIYEKR